MVLEEEDCAGSSRCCAKGKISVIRKILVQLQNLLQVVEKKSTKCEENRRLISDLEKIFEDVKRDLSLTEEKLSATIEKIWAGIDETAICLKGLEDIFTGKNKENSENDVYLPSFANIDDIVSEHYRRKFGKWNRLKMELENLARQREESIPFEIGRQWEVISCTFESEDEGRRDADGEAPEKRQKLQDSCEGIQGKENLRSQEEAEDDEKFAKFLEKQARRLQKKKKCKIVLKKSGIVNSENAPPKIVAKSPVNDIQLTPLQPITPAPPVLQELSLNREPMVEQSRQEPTSSALVPVAVSPVEPENITLSHAKPYSGPVFHTFEEMRLSQSLIAGINLWGLTDPYALEKIAIPAFISGIDMVVEGPPCTGKTTSAAIGLLSKVCTTLKMPQAIFLVPNDQLVELVMGYMSDLGTLLYLELSSCDAPTGHIQKSQIIVGTPVKVNCLIAQRQICTDSLKVLVVDSCEELTPESQATILQVLYSLPGSSQFVMLTRRVTTAIVFLSQRMRSPAHVNCSNESILAIVPRISTPETILLEDSPTINPEEMENENPRPSTSAVDYDAMSQFYVVVETDELKIRVLAALADTMELEQAIIFCNSGQKADWLAQKIRENEKGLEVCSVHAERKNRDYLLSLFQAGASRVLITTDFITESTFKVKPVSLVLNYEFPESPENYIRRIMCAGRSRNTNPTESGEESSILVFSFVTAENLPQLQNLAAKYNFGIAPMSSQP